MSKVYKQTIKYYHILLLSIILSPLLIINSNFAVEKRNKEKLNIEADRKFKKILFGRHLETFEEGMKKICNKGTEELKEYYNSGALSKLDIDLPKNEEEEENPEYINALLDIVKGYVGEESEHDIMENAKTYGMHILGIGVFLVIAILSIPGWIVCCFCCCCNCCCCCCCKKPSCKVPFFIVTTVLYVLVAAVCIFGLIKSNYIFKGVADTECSILKFFNEIIEGETKTEKPKWAGINGIKTLIDDVKTKIHDINAEKESNLDDKDDEVRTTRNDFEVSLQTNSRAVIGENSYNMIIANNQDPPVSYNYRFDITTRKVYGEFTKGASADLNTAEPEGSFIWGWYQEYSATVDNIENNIGQAISTFDTVLNEHGPVASSLDSAKESVDEIGNSIKEIKDSISTSIIEYSDYIDDYGKLGFKVYFTALVVIDASIAFLMFLLCFFSRKLCNKCCCCRCIFKLFIHLFWNILALLMIITFLIGFLFSFIGTIGKDMVSVLNYFISAENLGKEEPTLFGEAGTKLNSCFNGDGVILENLDAMGSFDQLDEINNNLMVYERRFGELSDQSYAYQTMTNALNERAEYSNCDFTVIGEEGANPPLYKFSDFITQFNNKMTSDYWSCCCSCQTLPTGRHCKSIKDDDFPTSFSDPETNAIIAKINKIKGFINSASDEDDDSSYLKLTNNIEEAYGTFLSAELGILETFRSTISDLNGVFDEYVGENGSILDFINCKFIGNNILVILNNLKICLGGDFYTVGICLLMAGCSMAISICFTILLIIIINISVDQNKKEDNVKTIPYA